jgi:cysteine-rich repeat protein
VSVAVLLFAVPSFAVISNVDSANDVCLPSADPCVIGTTIEVVSGSLLDFGLRHVQITGGGEIDSATGSYTMRAGQLTANVSGNAFKLKGPIGDGFSSGGAVVVEILRRCSGNTQVTCFSDLQCAAVDAGACSVGSGNVNLSGKVLGSADTVGSFVMRAGGSITVNRSVTMTGNSFGADGGLVEFAANVDVIVNDRIDADSGGDAGGGEICLIAGRDVIVNDIISTTGGNFDGGSIAIDAERDIFVSNDVIADASTGEGFGGAIDMFAGNDLIVSGGTGTNRLFLSTQGNSGVCGGESFGGDGGAQDYFADGNIYFSQFVKIRADGAAPDGYGEVISFDAGGNILIEADIDSRARGALGGGGEVEAFAFGDVEVASTSLIDVTGTDGGGGAVDIAPFGDVTLNGDIDVSATNTSIAGNIDVETDRDFTLGGTILINGGAIMQLSGYTFIAACNIDITSTGALDTRASLASNTLVYSDTMNLASGGSIKATGGGGTEIRYRSAPPTLSGTVNPTATLIRDSGLPACPLCANHVLNPGESCDDGNTVSGDGCTTYCVNEGCIAQTPGYPQVTLCDDGDGCTIDTCNPGTSSCEHSASCDDGIACTVDSCMGADCIHTPIDSLCEDANVCTDEFCSAATGCVFVPNSNPCDDEKFCTGTDSCAGGSCSVHVGGLCEGQPECQNACDEATRECLAPFFYPCSDDGNQCTEDVCNGLGQCIHLPHSGVCDDGIFCNGPDFCTNGACDIHFGDPCVGGAECFDVCQEDLAQCLTPLGGGCIDDGNICTDDTCDGAGTCLHTNNTVPCDDGDYCTTSDRCSNGECTAGDLTPMSARINFSRRAGPADDRAQVKATYLLSDQMADPSVLGVSIELRDASEVAFFNSTLPAAHIINSGGRGSTFKFRDKDGLVAEANGVRIAVIKRNANKNEVRVKIKTSGVELVEPVAEPSVSLSLLFGVDPQVDDCLSASEVPCVTRVAGDVKVRCRE